MYQDTHMFRTCCAGARDKTHKSPPQTYVMHDYSVLEGPHAFGDEMVARLTRLTREASDKRQVVQALNNSVLSPRTVQV